jgi:hypothetical protein
MSDAEMKLIYMMLFTGLQDSKGQDVYEGDIIKQNFYEVTIAEVIFSNGSYKLKKNNKEYPFILSKPYPPNYWCEVIGDVYQHPHLLENQSEESEDD